VGCWCGYFSAARCRLACGPADATATLSLASQSFFCKFDRSFLVTLLTNKQQFSGGSNSTDVLMFFNVFRVLSVLLSRVENLFYYDYVAKTTEFQKCIS